MKVLFVCNANIVRSFMAERLLRSRLKRAGLEGVDVSSAGVLARLPMSMVGIAIVLAVRRAYPPVTTFGQPTVWEDQGSS